MRNVSVKGKPQTDLYSSRDLAPKYTGLSKIVLCRNNDPLTRLLHYCSVTFHKTNPWPRGSAGGKGGVRGFATYLRDPSNWSTTCTCNYWSCHCWSS